MSEFDEGNIIKEVSSSDDDAIWLVEILPFRLKLTAVVGGSFFLVAILPDLHHEGILLYTLMLLKLAAATLIFSTIPFANKGLTFNQYFAMGLTQTFIATLFASMAAYLTGGDASHWALAPGLVTLVTGLLIILPPQYLLVFLLMPFAGYLTQAAFWWVHSYDALLTETNLFFYFCFMVVTAVGSVAQFRFARSQSIQYQKAQRYASEIISQAKELRYRAIESERIKSEFLANVSHEFMTPLTKIIGFCDLLERESVKMEADKECGFMIKQIHDSAGSLREMVDDLLELLSAEVNQGTDEFSEHDVTLLVHESIDSLQFEAKKRNVKLAADCPEQAESITFDRRRILRALMQLITNAITFSKSDCTVTVGYMTDGRNLRLYVQDEGQGLDSSDQALIFESFRQKDGSSTRQSGGLGIGLNLAKKMVELHGGHIEVESEPGEGSRFTIVLPKKQSSLGAHFTKNSS